MTCDMWHVTGNMWHMTHNMMFYHFLYNLIIWFKLNWNKNNNVIFMPFWWFSVNGQKIPRIAKSCTENISSVVEMSSCFYLNMSLLLLSLLLLSLLSLLLLSQFDFQSISQNVRLSVCPSVCLSVCSLLRYRLNVFLPPLPEVGCPIFLEIWNPWGKVMERSGLGLEHFCLEVV